MGKQGTKLSININEIALEDFTTQYPILGAALPNNHLVQFILVSYLNYFKTMYLVKSVDEHLYTDN